MLGSSRFLVNGIMMNRNNMDKRAIQRHHISTRALSSCESPSPNPFTPKFTIIACCFAALVAFKQSEYKVNHVCTYYKLNDKK